MFKGLSCRKITNVLLCPSCRLVPFVTRCLLLISGGKTPDVSSVRRTYAGVMMQSKLQKQEVGSSHNVIVIIIVSVIDLNLENEKVYLRY